MSFGQVVKDQRFNNLRVDDTLIVGGRTITFELSANTINGDSVTQDGTFTVSSLIASGSITTPQLIIASPSPANEIVIKNTSNGHSLTLTTSPTASSILTIPDFGVNSSFVLTDGAQTIAGLKTFTQGVPILATSNQLVLGTTKTVTLTSVAPAASRTYTIVDTGANSQFVMTDGNFTINGIITFTQPPVFPTGPCEVMSCVMLTNTSNQVSLGAGQTITLTAPTPVASRTYTIPDTAANSSFVMTDFAQTLNGVKTFSSGVPITAVTNQLVLGTTNTVTLTSPAPAASRTYTIPDTLANSAFVMTDLAQTINGSKTFSSAVLITPVTNQLVLGTTNTVTINSPAPAASRTYTIPDTLANSSFVMTDLAQTVNGAKTFSSAVTINPVTNQIVLGVTNTTTLNATAPAASRTYTIPDTGANSQFVMTDGNQTINGTKTFTTAPVFPAGGATFTQVTLTNTTNQVILGTTNTVTLTSPAPAASRTYTIPDTAANSSFVMTDLAQTINGVKTHTSQIPITATTNQLVLGTTNTVTLTSPAPAASRTYTIPDTLANSSFVMTDLAQTVNGAKTFSSAVTINPTTNQLVLGVTNTTTISSTAPAASRTYTIADAGGAATFVMTSFTGGQTISTALTLGTALTITPTTNQLVLGTTNTTTISSTAPAASRTYTIPDGGGAANVILSTAVAGTTTNSIQFGNATASYVPTSLNYYEEATLGPANWTGPVTVSSNVYLTRIGNKVCCRIQQVTGTSSAAAPWNFATNIPARFLPTTNVTGEMNFTCRVATGGTFSNGLVFIHTSGAPVGQIQVFADVLGANFSNTGTVTIYQIGLSWIAN